MKPNILYLHSHDTGRYVQPYGFAVPTPNIQELAEAGVLFTHAFCCAPTCSASRAALLTGQLPHSCGQFGLVNRGFELRDRKKHVAAVLAQDGYFTASAGVHHVVRDHLSCGYAERLDSDGNDHSRADRAVEFLSSAPSQPFFLSIGFANTHRKFPDAGDLEDERYCAPPLPLPNTPETRRDMADFKASARVLDDCMGRVLASLEENGLAENTLVICTTDHGIAFPKMKCNLTDHGIGVMLIIRGPKGFAGGQVCDALVSHLDVFPTICEVVGVARPDWLRGESIVPLVNGEAEEINDQVFSEVNFHAVYEPLRSVRTRRWKYIRRYTEYRHPIMAQIDDCPSKDVLAECGYSRQDLADEELYDVMLDPGEACSLVDSPAHVETLKDLRRRLDEWMEETDDPLRHGPVPAPEAAILSDPTDFSHTDIWQRRERPPGYG